MGTTVQAGAVNVAATWGGSVPAVGDNNVINHAVTVPSGVVFTSGDLDVGTAGTLTTETGGETAFRGYFDFTAAGTKRSSVVMQAGSTLTFDAANQQADADAGKVRSRGGFSNARFEAQGTLAQPVVIRQTGSGANRMRFLMGNEGNDVGSGWLLLNYCEFLGVGSSTQYAINAWLGWGGTNNAEIVLNNCRSDSVSGGIQLQSNLSSGSATGGVVRFDKCAWLGQTNGLAMRIEGTATGGTGEFVDGFFEGRVEFTANPGWTVNGTAGWQGIFAAGGSQGKSGLFQNLFRRCVGQDNSYLPGDTKAAFEYVEITGVGNNPHPIYTPIDSQVTYEDSVIDNPAAADTIGDLIIVSGTSATQRHMFRNNVMVPNEAGLSPGKIVSYQGNANSECDFLHNTYISDDGGGSNVECGLGIAETYNGRSDLVRAVKSNLAWSPNAGRAQIISKHPNASGVADIVLAANVTHNATWNGDTSTATGVTGIEDYRSPSNMFSTGSPNVSGVSVTADPFADRTRRAKSWAASLGFALSSSGLRDALLSRSDWRRGDYTPGTSRAPATLLAWVRDGFRVTSASLRNAGHDGVTIGAMPFLEPTQLLSVTTPIAALASGVNGTATQIGSGPSARTFTLMQGAVSLALVEQSGTDSTFAFQTIPAPLVATPVATLKRGPATLRVQVGAQSAELATQYAWPAGWISTDIVINPVLESTALGATPNVAVGDQLVVRGVGNTAAPAGLQVYADGTFGYLPGFAELPFEFAVWDQTDSTLSAFALASIGLSIDTETPTIPGTLTAQAISNTQITLTWTAATDNVAVSGYELQRCSGVACTNFSIRANQPGLTYTDIGLSENTVYRYRVRAYDAAGNFGEWSSIVQATTPSGNATGETLVAATIYLSSDVSVWEMSRSRVGWSIVDDNGVAISPQTLRYRIDCDSTGEVVQDWTDLIPATSGNIVIPARANRMMNQANPFEDRMVTVEANAATDDAVSDVWTYRVRNNRARA
jgi:hypothetical protein